MKTKHSSTLSLTILVLLISQLACQALTPKPQATPPPASTSAPVPTNAPVVTQNSTDPTQLSDNEIKAGIQESLDLYAQAYNENKPDALEQVLDQENKPFHRIVRSRFDEAQKSSYGGSFDYQFTLLGITRRDFGYVVAHFQLWNNYNADWPFRLVDGRWVLTEPTVEQVGEPVITETDHFIFTTYPWADDVNQKIMDLMETARANVEKVLGKVPDEKANVKIMPIYGLSPFNPMGAIALYNKEKGPIKNIIEVYTPESYAYSFYAVNLGWDGELQTTLTHEYTHMAHARSFGQAGRLSDWMSEGLAEYVANADGEVRQACQAFQSGTFIPILDESGAVSKQDLMHMYTLEKDFSLSYGFATSLVYFTVENYGGLDGFWKLATALDETSDFKKAVQKAFGITYEEYNNKWQAWLKKQC
ncbi:MAG: hypothetical protein ABI904_03930 [Chloroflexota bacterium]